MTIWGVLLIVAALLALVGASLGYGSGVALGYALLPVALVLLASGIVGRAVVTPDLDRAVVALGIVVAIVALLLAATGAISGLAIEPARHAAEDVLRPTFLALIVAIIAFALVGAWQRDLPIVPAAAVAIGSGMLIAALLGQERIADIGFWSAFAGWIGLGALPWGSA
jgi:hypothetical protein